MTETRSPAQITVELMKKADAIDLVHVRARFRKTFDVSEEDALACEREIKRYLVLTVAIPQNNHGMYGALVDEFWHTFLLFTVPYVNFCRDVLDYYAHHVPVGSDEEAADTGDSKAGKNGDGDNSDDLTFEDFARDYEIAFGEPLPEIWRSPAPVRNGL